MATLHKNYITKKLEKINNSYIMKEPAFLKILNEKVKTIRKYMDPIFVGKVFKRYGELKLTDYIKKSSTKVNITDSVYETIFFAHSKKILENFDELVEYQLKFPANHIISIKIYHNKNDDETIFSHNVHKIMMRIYNMLILYAKKENPETHKTVTDFTYTFFLYNNPRRANHNLGGKKYMKDMNNNENKCFNISSGATIHNNNLIVVSRTEGAIGLLTHEMLHSSTLVENTADFFYLSEIEKKYVVYEMFVNSFATIIHAYLYSYEYEDESEINKNILHEICHALFHSARLSINTGVNIEEFIKSEGKNWYQEAYLYEYINGKLMILLFFGILFDETQFGELGKNLLSLEVGYVDDGDKICLNPLKFIKHIHNIFLRSTESKLLYNVESFFSKLVGDIDKTTQCGDMIQEYFCLDPMEIEKIRELPLFGGGYKNYKRTYMKYCRKINVLLCYNE